VPKNVKKKQSITQKCA